MPQELTQLHTLVPQTIWTAQQPLRLGPLKIQTRMTVVRLGNGKLWVHSPIRPTPDVLAELETLGPVGYVVAPNTSHHLFFADFLRHFPEAEGCVAPGLHRKRPDLRVHAVLTPELAQRWQPDLTAIAVEGLPALNETVWFHPVSGTLIVTDLLFCFSDRAQWLGPWVARLLGVWQTLGMSRTLKWLVQDRAALQRTARQLCALEVRRVVVAHDTVVEHDARDALRRAFAWLG